MTRFVELIRSRGKLFSALGMILALLLTGQVAWGQSLDNKGTDFILGFLHNAGRPSSQLTVELHLTSDTSTMVTVEYPVNSPTFTTTVAVNPGAITIVSLPGAAAAAWPSGSVANNAVRAFADDEFVVYMINLSGATSDAALGLPIDTMNTEYIAYGYTGTGAGHSLDAGEFVVVAAFDSTTVTITPTVALKGGFPAGTAFNVVLNKGEGFQAESLAISGAGADITGSTVSADKPVGMTTGNQCANVPNNVCCCDHVFEVAQPIQSWGLRALATNLPQRTNGSIYRVIASENSTTVSLDGGLLGTINKGDFFETGQLTGNHIFEGDKPIYAVQYMTSDFNLGATNGDPAMGNLIPDAQFLSDYTFSTVGGGKYATNHLSIIVETADVGATTLDAVPIAAGSFSLVGGSGFSAAVLSLTGGTHDTSSTGVHGIWVEGYNPFDSYLFPGGALFQFINPVGDENPPICTILNASIATGTAEDSLPTEDVNGNGILDAGEDLNGNGLIDEDTGIFFIQLMAGAVNLTLTPDPFVPGDPLVGFIVSPTNPALPASGIVIVTDGAGNTDTCTVSFDVCDDPDPRTQGFYHRQCLGAGLITPGRNGRGPQEPNDPDFLKDDLAAAELVLQSTVFISLACEEGMDADPPNDPCERALKQYTALVFNVVSGRLSEGCGIDLTAEGCTSTTVGALVDELAALINSGDPDACRQAAECAAAINEGQGIQLPAPSSPPASQDYPESVDAGTVTAPAGDGSPSVEATLVLTGSIDRSSGPVEGPSEEVGSADISGQMPLSLHWFGQLPDVDPNVEDSEVGDRLPVSEIDRHLAVFTNRAAPKSALKASEAQLMMVLGGGYEPELRLRIVRVLVERVDLALHSVLAKHLEDIEAEAKDRGIQDLAGQAKQLRNQLEPGTESGE